MAKHSTEESVFPVGVGQFSVGKVGQYSVGIKTREGVLRYLLMLLADTGLTTTDGDTILGDGSAWSEGWIRGDSDLPLLETLIQALDRDPARLDRVARLLQDLQRVSPELLPLDIQPVWDVVWKVRKELADE